MNSTRTSAATAESMSAQSALESGSQSSGSILGGGSFARQFLQHLGSISRTFLLVLALSSVAGTALAWRATFSGSHVNEGEVVSVLQDVYRRELMYLKSNATFTPDFHSLGMEPPARSEWTFEIITARGARTPMLLVEARSHSKRLAIDENGTLYRSNDISLPVIPKFVPTEAPTKTARKMLTPERTQPQSPPATASTLPLETNDKSNP